jgi:diguanylate cyclase (GGDEF)-like protein
LSISAAERTTFRLSVARRETPRALVVTGGCFVAITLVNALFGPSMAGYVFALNGAVAMLLLGSAALARTSLIPLGAWPWIAAVCALAMVTVGLIQVWRAPDGAAFAYVLLIVVAYAPLTLSWLPAVLAEVPMLLGCVLVARLWPPAEATDWMIASLGALAIGLALLWVRLHSIDELAELTAQVRVLATRDQLTGVLNRRGIEERVPVLAGLSDRVDEPVFLIFLDIVGLKRINDRRGHPAGDMALVVVADALCATVRSGDVVGRWGGDEFIVVGLGSTQDPDTFRERVLAYLRDAGADAPTATLDVSAGLAVSSPRMLDFESLVSRADEDMYRRRRAMRAS